MDSKIATDKILEGVDIKSALSEESVYDEKWEKQVWDAAKNVFAADKKLWDLMVFAPEKYNGAVLQDALNAFSKWYQDFLAVKKGA